MGKLTCGCLNVTVHPKSPQLTPVDGSTYGLQDEFFSQRLAEVVLNIEGVHYEHRALVQKRVVGTMVIHRCLNCSMLTHAAHAGDSPGSLGKVLVSMCLKDDPKVQEKLAESSDFSPLFRIVMPSRPDNHPLTTLGVQSEKYESLKRTLSDIQQQLNKYLTEEENLMEERIRQFEETQRQTFALLQSKVRRDKNSMMSLILATEEQKLEDSLTEAISDVSLDANAKNNNPGSKAPLLVAMPSAVQPITSTPASRKTPRSLGERLLSATSRGGNNDTVDADGDLDFDSAFHDSSHPFYESDDEPFGDTEDTDDSEPDLRGRHSIGNHGSNNIYSASMPVSVPMWNGVAGRVRQVAPEVPGRGGFNEMEEDMSGSGPVDPQNMAASIKALARSVHGDGTEIFGELPRRRITSDFSNL